VGFFTVTWKQDMKKGLVAILKVRSLGNLEDPEKTL